MDDKYYTEELNYLLELGKEFSKQHPEKAQMLHMDDVRSREPNLERLLESFAFLSSRVRKRIDSDFPQIADALFGTMWPGYINPIPSFALLEFVPALWDSTEAVIIPKGALIDSEPTDNDVQCRFRTCFDASVFPIEVTEARVESAGSSAQLNLSISFFKETNIESLREHKLKIHIFDDPAITWQLYNIFLGRKGRKRYIETISVTGVDSDNRAVGTWQLTPDVISPVGLSADELLLPTTRTNLWCFELLRDFFLFPEKYQAFNIAVFEKMAGCEGIQTLRFKINLNVPWPSNLKVRRDQFRPNTVPIVNLFSHDANPIRLNDLHRQYAIEGDGQYPQHFQIYSVDHVESIEVNTNARRVYAPRYTSRSHVISDAEQGRFYSIERSKAPWGGWDSSISFINTDVNDQDSSREEIVSLNATCTNGRLASKLAPKQIHFPISYVDQRLNLHNITAPTAYIIPDIEQISLWRWLSHAALNYMSIHSAKQLKALLSLHDFSNADANRRKIDGIKDVEMKTTRTLFKGALIPGISASIRLDEKSFASEGEIQLFALVLSVFMSAYATINSYIQLTVIMEPSGHAIELEPQIGESFPI